MPLNVSPLKSVSSAKNHKDGIVKEPYTTVRFLYNPSVMRTGRHYFCASTLSVFLAGSKGQESYSIGEYLFTPESATLLHKPTGEATLIPRREADILPMQRQRQHHPHPEHPPVSLGRRRLLQRPQPPGPHHPPPPPLLPRPPHPHRQRPRHRLQADRRINSARESVHLHIHRHPALHPAIEAVGLKKE